MVGIAVEDLLDFLVELEDVLNPAHHPVQECMTLFAQVLKIRQPTVMSSS